MNEARLTPARRKAVDLLQKVINGSLLPEEARTQWPKYENDNDLDKAFHLLYHFEDDEDIRKKDKQYADWQANEIRKYILLFLSNCAD